MPILHVKALPQENKEIIPEALKKTTRAISAQYGCDSQHVWATWQEIHPGWYLEGENQAYDQPSQNHPPICELICF